MSAMDLSSSPSSTVEPEFTPSYEIATDIISTMPNILCCLCGASMQPNNANMCVNCLRSQVDITDGITKQVPMFQCRGCGKYLRPPWVHCELESRQLLALCLKKVKGLNKVKLIDANFIWTEPHSKRIKIKLTVQKEVLNGVILQQTFMVEFIVQNQQCDACQKSYTDDPWKAKLQLRQKVDHKRTFFYLEQVILKHSLFDSMTQIKEEADGLDFYFPNRSAAQRLLDFFSHLVPIRAKEAKKLVSQDYRNNTVNYKYTIHAEIAPICKHDLVCLPKSIAKDLGGLAPFQLVVRLTSNVCLVDPFTCQRTDISQLAYYKNPFVSSLSSRQLTEFMVLDIQKLGQHVGKFALAEATIARLSEMERSDKYFIVKTHLGNLLNTGDTVFGYDLSVSHVNENEIDCLKGMSIPDVVLVKKSFQKSNRHLKRKWALKSLDKEKAEVKKRDENKEIRDFEEFAQELEEDPEMRLNVNIYKQKDSDTYSQLSTDEDAPRVPMAEMLTGLTFENKIVALNPQAALAHAMNELSDTLSDTVSIIGDEDEIKLEDLIHKNPAPVKFNLPNSNNGPKIEAPTTVNMAAFGSKLGKSKKR